MRYSTAFVGAVAFCVSEVAAFPAAAIEYAAKAERDAAASASVEGAVAKFRATRASPGFNAAAQYVSTEGKYAFVAPDLTVDQRGPCPGLNAMANHGYIPHNGVATIQQFIDGTYAGTCLALEDTTIRCRLLTFPVFGMGKDLGGFLGLYGALIDGDGTKWSIGGPTPFVPATLGLLGEPQGISGSHNKYEGDASPARPDLYQ